MSVTAAQGFRAAGVRAGLRAHGERPRYRELTSTSNCTTFQARRLDIRHRTGSGKTAPVATLNGTLATTRWIVAILETHQQADGSVVVPEALRGYLGGLEVLEPVAR